MPFHLTDFLDFGTHRWLLILASLIPAYLSWEVLRTQVIRRRLPGPVRWPIIGNTWSMTMPYNWQWYLPLSLKYGPILQLSLWGDNVVLVSDPKIAEEILGKRAANYSSRKHLPFSSKYRSADKRMLLMPYGAEFVKQRAAMQLLFRPDGIVSNRERQRQQNLQLLVDFIEKPGQWDDHLKRYSSGVALGVSFGMTIAAADRCMPEMLASNDAVGRDLRSGTWLVDSWPWLDWLPDILAPWRAIALAKHEEEFSTFALWAKEAHDADPGVLRGQNLVAQLWEKQQTLGIDAKAIAYVGGSVGEAGTNTTQCVIAIFLFAWALYPDVMRRAQEELDERIGDRIPNFSDFYDLPYVFAVVKEVLRWVPPTPLALPHLADNDDVYGGYHIPSGSLVVTSVWNMHRNPELYHDPDTFDPMRFYKTTVDGKLPADASLNTGHYAFSFGRRACPGYRLAIDSVWLAAAHFLWSFNIEGDGTERVLAPKRNPFAFLKWRDAVNIEPKALPIRVTSRREERIAAIYEAWNVMQDVVSS